MLDDRECFEESKEEFRLALRVCGFVVDDDEQLFEYYKGIRNVSKGIAQIVATWSELFQQAAEVFREVGRQLFDSVASVVQETMDFEKVIEELKAMATETQTKESHRPQIRSKGKKSSYRTIRPKEYNRVRDCRKDIRKRRHNRAPRAPPEITKRHLA